MTNPSAVANEEHHDNHHDEVYSKTVFGFWIYLLTDFILFGVLFATYLVLHKSTFGGPTSRDLFHLPFTLVQTLVLLVSTTTIGLGGAAAHRRNTISTVVLFVITFFLGVIFVWMGFFELSNFVKEGYTWAGSAFLSMFFTLIGTYSAHMLFALLWIILLMISVFREGITSSTLLRLTCLRMFWQFLNIIWIFIFTVVYLLGVIV